MADKNFEMIFCIINAGFSDTVMDAARDAGARGGTVIRGRGTANREAENKYGITIQPDKEIIMILVSADIKDAVLKSVYKAAGLDTDGQGIAFSMPVDKTIGIGNNDQ